MVRTVASASATSRADPREEPAEPLRSRCATTTGAPPGVAAVASSAFNPRTRVYPNPAPCLAYPCTSMTVSSTSSTTRWSALEGSSGAR